MVKQADVSIVIDDEITSAVKMVLDGMISVSEFVFLCDRYGFIVSSINQVTNTITIVCDTGETDEETNLPIVVWKDIDVTQSTTN